MSNSEAKQGHQKRVWAYYTKEEFMFENNRNKDDFIVDYSFNLNLFLQMKLFTMLYK